MKVAVYGTLRKDCGNHRHLEGARYIGDGHIRGFHMHMLGGFPGVLNVGGPDTVKVEVYEIDPYVHLRGLDRLEGYDAVKDRGMYLRRTTTVYYEGGTLPVEDAPQPEQVNYYLWNGGNGMYRIDNGDWVNRHEVARDVVRQ